MERLIELDGRTIEYDLIRKNVKNLNLRIKADQSIYVSANINISENDIQDYLQNKSDYILKALDRYAEIAKYTRKPKMYVDGESFTILGHDLRLKVIQIQGKRNCVVSDGIHLTMTVKIPNDTIMKQRTMDNWIKKQCQENIQEVCESIYQKFQKYGIEFPTLRFRNMVSCWGSCQPKRKVLTFNIALIEAPLSAFNMWLARVCPLLAAKSFKRVLSVLNISCRIGKSAKVCSRKLLDILNKDVLGKSMD